MRKRATMHTFRGAVLKRVVGAILVAGALFALSLGVVACSTPEPETEDADVSTTDAALAGGWDAVTWTGDGRFVVAQTFDAKGTPVIMTWDAQTEETSELAEYVVLGVEPASSVVWVEPTTAEDVAYEMLTSADAYLDVGPVDTPPERMEAWDLSADGAAPSDAVPGKYQPVEGGVEEVAYLEVDPTKGALPSKLLFNNLESSGDGYKASLPDDLVTFVVVGWSPSGEYFAVEEMLSKEALLEDEALADGTGSVPERRLIVVEASGGEVVTEATLSEGVLSPVQWLGDSDTLVWVEDTMGESEVAIEVMALEVGSEPATFFEITGVEIPAEWSAVGVPTPLGSGTFGLVVSAWSEEEGMTLWRLDSVSVERIGVMGYVDHLDWSATGGVTWLVVEGDDASGEDWIVVSVSDESGAESREVLTGPKRPFPADLVQ